MTNDKWFREVPYLKKDDISARILCNLILLREKGQPAELALTVAESRALRDWLNKVLP